MSPPSTDDIRGADAPTVYRWLRPSKPQPTEATHFYELDRLPFSTYSRPVFIYRNADHTTPFMPTNTLVDALHQTLDHFPICYGRLIRLDNQLDNQAVGPSSDGIPVYETLLEQPIDAFDARWTYRSTPHAISMPQPRATDGASLLIVKITRFGNNSGVVIALMIHHFLTDISGAALFMHYWADCMRGTSPTAVLHRRDILRGNPEKAPAIVPGPPVSGSRDTDALLMHVTKEHLAALKRDVSATLPTATDDTEVVPWISSLDALTAMIPHTRLRLDPVTQEQHECIQILMATDTRSSFPHLIPANYFGNGAVGFVYPLETARTLVAPIGHLAAKIRWHVSNFDEPALHSLLRQRAEMHHPWSELETNSRAVGETIMCATDWTKCRLYDIDFGNGHPERVRVGSPVKAPTARYIRGPDGAVEAYITAPPEVLERMRRDPTLCKYSKWIE